MSSTTFEKFSGLYVQKNSYTTTSPAFEEAENITLVYDNLVTKRRGYHLNRQFDALQDLNYLFEYQGDIFAVTQDKLYRVTVSSVTAQASCTATSNVITVTRTDHGLTTGDYVSQFQVSDSEQAFYNAWPDRQADFYGSWQVTVTGANTFTFIANEVATASATTGATSASYLYYTRVGGVAVSVTPSGVIYCRSLKASQNDYFLTDNGLLKLERKDLPVLKAGIPPGLDINGVLGVDSAGLASGPIPPNSQVGYRVVFGRRDANQNLVLGAPSAIQVFTNPRLTPSSVSYLNPTLTINYMNHGLTTGDIVALFNMVGTGALEDGYENQVTVIDPNQFTIDLDNGTTAPSTVTDVKWAPYKTARIAFSIPSELNTTEYLYQIYRSDPSVSDQVPPQNIFRLVTEANLTAPQISAEVVFYTDEIPDAIRGPELYTNETQEGELQSNARPPFARDLATYKGFVMYANTKSYPVLQLAVVAPNLLSNGTILTLGGQDFIFRKIGTQNEAVANIMTTSSATRVGTTVTVTQVNNAFVSNDTIYIYEDTLLGITAGVYTITVIDADHFSFTSAGAGVTGTMTYEGRQNAAGKWIVKAYNSTNAAPVTTISEAIDGTARSILKAVNRDASSTTYGTSLSGVADTPGKMAFIGKNLTTSSFSATISVLAEGDAFFPTLPTSGITVSSVQDSLPNNLQISKFQEPEGVPLVNSLQVGSQGAAILRIATLRDSLIIIKEDGVFRLNGDDPNNFTVVPLDSTVICKAENSAAVLNNAVYCLTNQGVVQISDNGVQVMSRDIEPLFQAVINNPNLNGASFAVAYESDRHYILSTISPNSIASTPDVSYIYNYLTNTWVRWDTFMTCGILYPISDSLYYGGPSRDIIYSERKDQTKKDFTGQEAGVPVYRGKVANMASLQGSPQIQVTSLIDHGMVVGQLITVAQVSPNVAAIYPGGAPDVTGLRVVTAVIDQVNFRFDAASNATATLSGERIEYQDWISEDLAVATATMGSNTVSVTTTQPHQLSTGLLITVQLNGITTAFPVNANILGTRSVTVTGLNTFTINAGAPAAASQTGTLTISDRRQDNYYVTLRTPANLTPEVGDAIIYGIQLYKILELIPYSSTRYLVKLNYQAIFLSTSATMLHSFYESRMRFSPFTMNDPGKLKFWSEYQAQFRSSGDCTRMIVDFACDSKTTTGPVTWLDAVGTGAGQVIFQGWGLISWGTSPWGEGENINRQYTTSPAVILRTLVPLDAFTATFSQPIMRHRVAGEAINLQAVAFDWDNVSTTSTR